MKKRMAITLLAVVFFLGAIAFVKFRQVQTAMAQGKAFRPPPEAVTTIKATEERWPATLSSIGSVQAVNGVTVSADLPGIVQKITFESGRPVKAGDVLVLLDSREEKAQLAAAQADRDLAAVKFRRIDALTSEGVTAMAEHDQASADLKRAEAQVGQIEATIARKTITAPFSGVLGIRQVDVGQYLKAGDPIVPLQSLDPIYVNFSVPQQQLALLRVGGKVEGSTEGAGAQDGSSPAFTARGAGQGGESGQGGEKSPSGDNGRGGEISQSGVSGQGGENGQSGPSSGGTPDRVRSGKITAINSVVDEATRNVQVQATFANPDGSLRPGMFVRLTVAAGPAGSVISVPASSISYAPYGDSVFLVEDMKGPDGQTYRGVRQQFVKLGGARGDRIAILSGVKPGEEVVTSGVFKLYNGAAVTVNNEVQPSNSANPRPEDS